jgi:hypothetical protein
MPTCCPAFFISGILLLDTTKKAEDYSEQRDVSKKIKTLKRSEIKKLVEEYKLLKRKPHHHNAQKRLKEIERRYYHETGQSLSEP